MLVWCRVRNLNIEDKYAYDGWGRKFSFQVATGMGLGACPNSTNPIPDFLNNNFKGDIKVSDIYGNERTNYYSPKPNNFGAAYVIVSHGPNGTGAWGKNTTTGPAAITLATNTIAPEYQNTKFLYTLPSITMPYIQDNSNYLFDDIVRFKQKNELLPIKAASPIRIPRLTCSNANNIVDKWESNSANYDSSSASSLCNLGSPIIKPAGLCNQIYQSALNIKQLCSNPPTAAATSTSANSCTNTPYLLKNNGLELWLDASDPNADSTTPSVGPLAIWKDKSGNARNTNAGTGATYNSTSPYANNRASLYFNGTTNYYYVSLLPSFIMNNSSYTVFVVDAVGSFTNYYKYSFTTSSSTTAPVSAALNQNLHLGYRYQNDYSYAGLRYYFGQFNNDIYTQVTNNQAIVTPYMPTILMGYLNTGSGAVNPAYLGRTVKGTNINNVVSLYNDSTKLNPLSNIAQFNIGVNYAKDFYFEGYIAEILVFSTALSQANIEEVEGYLKRKWFTGECP